MNRGEGGAAALELAGRTENARALAASSRREEDRLAHDRVMAASARRLEEERTRAEAEDLRAAQEAHKMAASLRLSQKEADNLVSKTLHKVAKTYLVT